jgi:hypothetical protein
MNEEKRDEMRDAANEVRDEAREAAARARETADEMHDEARETADRLRNQAREAANNGQQAAEGIQHRVLEQIEAGRERAAATIGQAAGTIRERTEPLNGLPHDAGIRVADNLESAAIYLQQHETREVGNDAVRFAKQHPVQAALIGLIGLFLLKKIL